jgi:hypothetical protein
MASLGVPFCYPFFAPASMGYDESILKYQYNPARQDFDQGGPPEQHRRGLQ